MTVEWHIMPGRTLDERACFLDRGSLVAFACSIVAALVGTALMVAAPRALGAVPPDDRLILEGEWVTPDNRLHTVVREGGDLKITGPPPPGACPRPGGVFGTVRPTADPALYAGETFRYDTEDCSVVGTAPLQVKVTQDPKIPEIQSFTAESEGQALGGADRRKSDAEVDFDGDKIPDWTESNGINVLAKNDAGEPVDVLLNFPAMGADPTVKDVFVEIDSMPGRQYENLALQIVQDSFLIAPVPGGINLHVDNGPASVMNPRTEETWGSRSEGTDTVPFKDKLGARVGDQYSFDEFSALKEKFFRSDVRGSYFRYAIAANKINDAKGVKDDGSTGIAAGVGKPDFIITMPVCGKKGQPAWRSCALTTFHQAAAFMHEFGHTLGLAHGGGDNINDKPNYFSAMNYAVVFVGLGAAHELRKPEGPRRLDYSRFGPGDVTQVDENKIDEQSGIEVSDPSSYSLVRFCAKNGPGVLFQAGTPVDWSCNGRIDPAPVPFDVNFDGKKDVLETFNDWAGLEFVRPASRQLTRQAVTVPYQETRSLDQLLRQAARTLGDTRAPRLSLTRRGRRVTVTARDRKRVDRLVVSVGRKIVSSPDGKTGRKLRVKTRLKRGRQVVSARAMDWAGNQSRPLNRKVRVR